jgi:hypothetical protein
LVKIANVGKHVVYMPEETTEIRGKMVWLAGGFSSDGARHDLNVVAIKMTGAKRNVTLGIMNDKIKISEICNRLQISTRDSGDATHRTRTAKRLCQ